ncbi:MAG: acyltransferase domain-containing protein [Actinomycetota bacterium]|nr:acyltransferase domain-containing protein [Actinomycetota bacterium]
MGEELFAAYPDMIAQADKVLGWPVADVCRSGDGRLDQTQFTQPALFVVNALSYLHKLATVASPPAYLAGHSLGEFNALHAAGVFDFVTGLRLVAYRGEIMARCGDGAMAAVLGLGESEVRSVLTQTGPDVELANCNSLTQVVISGPRSHVEATREPFLRAGAGDFVMLAVSGAFHSRYMASAADDLATFIGDLRLRPPRIPVISNVTAQPYDNAVQALLVAQLTGCVRWYEGIGYLLDHGIDPIEQVGPGRSLTRLTAVIRRQRLAGSQPGSPADTGVPAGPRRQPVAGWRTGS